MINNATGSPYNGVTLQVHLDTADDGVTAKEGGGGGVEGGGGGGNDSGEFDVLMTPMCELYTVTMYGGLVGLICVLGLIGNIVAFIVFCADKIKTSTSFLFQGLSVIDSLFLIIVCPIYSITTLLEYAEVFNREDSYVVTVHLLPHAYILQTSTIWVTVLVGFNRYVAVCYPFKATRLCTVRQARRQLVLVLVLAALYTAPKFAEVPLGLQESYPYNIIYNNVMYGIFLLIIPLASLSVLNIRLINALNELKRRRAEMQSLRQQQDNNVTFVLIIVVIVFIICQLPALVNHLLWTLLPDDLYRECGQFQFYYRRFSNVLVILNSAVNFPIYVLFNTRFRQVLAQFCCSASLDGQGHRRDGATMTRLGGVTTAGGYLDVEMEPGAVVGGCRGNGVTAEMTKLDWASVDVHTPLPGFEGNGEGGTGMKSGGKDCRSVRQACEDAVLSDAEAAKVTLINID